MYDEPDMVAVGVMMGPPFDQSCGTLDAGGRHLESVYSLFATCGAQREYSELVRHIGVHVGSSGKTACKYVNNGYNT